MAQQDNKPFPDGEFTPQEMKALGQCNALTNQEAKIVLKRFMETAAKGNKTWAPPPLAQKAMEYLDKVEAKTDAQHSDTVQRLREAVGASEITVHEYEMALLANLTPETADEALHLVPSLQQDGRFETDHGKQVLQGVLDEILTLKELQ